MKPLPIHEKLTERVKELSCLIAISKTISQAESIERKILRKIIDTTKKAWRYSGEAIVEIKVLDYNLTTSKLSKNTIFQSSCISLPDAVEGYIKVHYPQKKYILNPFLDDEQKLLDTIAIEVQNYIQKFYILEKKAVLQKTVERMDRLSVIGEMAAGIAHELNNPLANILGYAELIKHSNSDPEIDSDITTVINSVIYIREIVKKLMFFSSEIPNEPKLEDIKSIVTFALSFLKQNFQKKNIKSEVIFKNDTTKAKFDSIQLTQILFNLIINALHASPENSLIKIIIENDSHNLFLTIEDQGTGIPDTIKSKIFEPFFTTKTVKEGSGLGLSVVHGIVKTHKGNITLTNNFPTGTIFKISLPLS
jgi:two-component system NtrC family sensor kinase